MKTYTKTFRADNIYIIVEHYESENMILSSIHSNELNPSIMIVDSTSGKTIKLHSGVANLISFLYVCHHQALADATERLLEKQRISSDNKEEL